MNPLGGCLNGRGDYPQPSGEWHANDGARASLANQPMVNHSLLTNFPSFRREWNARRSVHATRIFQPASTEEEDHKIDPG